MELTFSNKRYPKRVSVQRESCATPVVHTLPGYQTPTPFIAFELCCNFYKLYILSPSEVI